MQPLGALGGLGGNAGGAAAGGDEASLAAERAKLKQVRSFLNSQARLIKGRQAQLQADQAAWKRSMKALVGASGGGGVGGGMGAAGDASGGEESERLHAIMRKLRHTIERQASTLNDDTEHLQSCFLWLKQLESASRAAHPTSEGGAAGKGGAAAG